MGLLSTLKENLRETDVPGVVLGVCLILYRAPGEFSFPPNSTLRGLSNVVPAVWGSWETRARAASQQGPATAQPTAPAMSMLTVSLNAMVQCLAR